MGQWLAWRLLVGRVPLGCPVIGGFVGTRDGLDLESSHHRGRVTRLDGPEDPMRLCDLIVIATGAAIRNRKSTT